MSASSRTLAVLALLSLGSVDVGHGDQREATLETELEVARELLQEDRGSYATVRERESEARARADELARRLDDLVLVDEIGKDALAEIQEMESAYLLASEMANALADRGRDLRLRVEERLRLIERLGALVASTEESERSAEDPVSGRWAVQILPSGQLGTFTFELDGTLVSGSYRLDGAERGSFRGTYVGRTLKLERVDSRQGLDVILEGRVETAQGLISGTWSSTLLTAAGPPGGTWSARRIGEEERE